jgi:hypothetical protein
MSNESIIIDRKRWLDTCTVSAYYCGKLWRERLIKFTPLLSLLLTPVVMISMQLYKIMYESFFETFLFPIENAAVAGLLAFGIKLRFNNLFY